MTVATPGDPCLTQTQITRNENQERFLKHQEEKNAVAQSQGSFNAQKSDKITGVEKTDNQSQSQLSYGAPGPHLIDISA